MVIKLIIGGFWFSGFICASSYWGIQLFRVCLCVKLLRDSSFQDFVPVREAIGGPYFLTDCLCITLLGDLLLVVLVLVVLVLVLVLLYLKHAPSFGNFGSIYTPNPPSSFGDSG